MKAAALPGSRVDEAALLRSRVKEAVLLRSRVKKAVLPRPRMAAVLAAALLMAALALPGAALAADCPQTTLGDVEDEVMCSICGTPLGLASEAPQAQAERAYIERLIADCRSKDDIKRALVAQFGESVLALPGDAGDDDGIEDTLVYVIPAVGLVLAGAGIAFAVTRWRRRPEAGTAAPAGDSGRVDLDMERYDL